MMKTKVTFTLPAANIIGADECVLLGDFNNWNLEEGHYLKKQADGNMKVEVELEAGKEYQYRYLLGNGRWVNDDNEKITSDMSGFPVENCIIRVAAVKEKAATGKPKAVKPKNKSTKAKPLVPVKDNLTRVEGVGKKIESLLYKNKIYSFKQLSKTTIKSLKEILEEGGSKYAMHNPGSWPKQAKLAADAKWEDLELLQKHLKGGK